MGLVEVIRHNVSSIATVPWETRDGRDVPLSSSIALKNGAVKLEAVYLFADLADSSGLARDFDRPVAARVVRAFLSAASSVIGATGGEIRGFDGDRVMAIYVGGSRRTQAANCALNLNYAVQKIVRPTLEAKIPSIKSKGYVVSHCAGVASGEALLVRGGVRGDNDLISIGRPPNVAAKLSEIRNAPYCSYVTADVYRYMNESARFSKSGENMWEARTLKVGGGQEAVYRSSWRRAPS